MNDLLSLTSDAKQSFGFNFGIIDSKKCLRFTKLYIFYQSKLYSLLYPRITLGIMVKKEEKCSVSMNLDL